MRTRTPVHDHRPQRHAQGSCDRRGDVRWLKLNQASSRGDKLHERRIKRIFLMPAVLYLLCAVDLSPVLVAQHQLHRLSAGHGVSCQRQPPKAATTEPTRHSRFRHQPDAAQLCAHVSGRALHTAAINTLTFVLAGVMLQYMMGFLLALVLHQQFYRAQHRARHLSDAHDGHAGGCRLYRPHVV